MIECESCHRHRRVSDEACPFCARPARSLGGGPWMMALGAAVTTIVLSACYGTPPTKSTTGGTGNTGDTGAPTTPSSR